MPRKKGRTPFDRRSLPSVEDIQKDFSKKGYADQIVRAQQERFNQLWNDSETDPTNDLSKDELIEYLRGKK